MPETNDKELLENILSCARSVSEEIDELLELSENAVRNAGKYEERIAVTAAALRNDTCAHMRGLVEDMEQAVKIKL
ncbi:MAG: hypothetical protein Q4G33_01305 [bacterium]|nr:hypothetical protein [bacterium]